MSERCEYHWFYEKRDGAVVCAECRDPIENNSRYRALDHDHWISETHHAKSCGRDGVSGFLILHITADGRGCEGSVPACPTCSRSGACWEMSGAGETLTLSPSVLCVDGDHGFVREGKWVPA